MTMKLFSNRFIFLLSLLLVGMLSGDLLAQSPSEKSKALEFYNQGMTDLTKEKYSEALKNFEQGYQLYKHAEIAYAVCHVYSTFNSYKQTEKYANLALGGSPRLGKDIRKDALTLLNWAKDKQKSTTEYSAKADGPSIPPPRTARPRQLTQQSDGQLAPNVETSNGQQLRGVYTIQQMSNRRYVDAHEHSKEVFALVTRPQQKNDTQKWILTPLGNNTYTIQQKSNNRYVDAHEHSKEDFALVTRSKQNNDSQRWLIKR